jgi:hypothetical protein
MARPYYEDAIALAQEQELPVGLRVILLANLTTLLEEQGEFLAATEWATKLEALGKNHYKYIATIQKEIGLIERWRKRAAIEAIAAGHSWHDVFISYNTNQTHLINCLHDELELRGLNAWTFQELDDWRTERPNEHVLSLMRGEIDRSAMLLAVASNTSVSSKFVAAEIDHALEQGLPVLMWYPEGVRLQPQVASKWSSTSQQDLRDFTLRLSRPGVYSYYGYGLRPRQVSVIADAILKRFAIIYPQHAAAPNSLITPNIRKGLDPTRLWPVILDSEGIPIVSELIVAATGGGVTSLN